VNKKESRSRVKRSQSFTGRMQRPSRHAGRYYDREAAGISDTFVFHNLRHTQASLMLAAGVDLKVIQKRLGHADFSTTANIYAHLLQGAQDAAVEKMTALMTKHSPRKKS
jgi:site-specific recombinase XerD